MNYNISAWSIRQPIPSIVLFLVLTLAGLLAFRGMGIDENPNIDIPIVLVSVAEVGAAPSELETQVTRKIEDAVAGIGNIKHIVSTVVEGSSTTSIEFELGINSDRAVNDVRDAVTRIRQQLPSQINEPIIQRLDFVGGPFATYSVTAPSRSIEQVSWLIDNEISRALLGVRGVGQVQRAGGVDREIRVELDPARLEALGLTPDAVNGQIRALNINLPGGRGDVGRREQSIRTVGSAETLQKLRSARISLPAGGWARLDTLGRVLDGAAEARQEAFLDGKPCVAFSVVRSTGSNLVDVEQGVDRALEKLRSTLPPDVQVAKVRTNGKYVMESYHASIDSLVLGALLAVVVIWLFLRDFRAAVISALAMPLSIIPTFATMKAYDFTLNGMSLLGLSLVIGILVDDAIVEIENIVRHIHMGKKPFDAALEAADEIGLAVVATTLTIIVVFVPVAFMGGIPGQFFKQFGLTVAVAVFYSLLVARLITPMMAAYWMKEPPVEEGKTWLVRVYERVLAWAMANRLATVLIALAFFVFSVRLFSTIPTTLIANADRGETVLSVELPPGSTLAQTRGVCQQLYTILHKRPEIARVFTSIGTAASNRAAGSSPGAGAVNTASLFIVLTPREERKASQQEIEQALRPSLQAVEGARVAFGIANGGLSGKVKVLLASEDAAALQAQAQLLIKEMRQLPVLSDVTSSAALARPEIVVEPDTARAAEQGVSVASVARTALLATLGDIDMNLPKFDLADRQLNIRVQLVPSWRNQLERIGSLKVATQDGRLIPLQTVASIRLGEGPSQVDRYDRQRQVSIEASLPMGVTLGEALDAVHALRAYKDRPASILDKPVGDAEIQRDVFGGFFWAMEAAVVLIYAVLVLLFEGFLQPLTIMMSLPLSIGGALMGLIVVQQPLGMFALIGIVMLMGLATKNAILLVEYCLKSIDEGMTRYEAIASAGEARMRPILMTTIAMIAGMMPIAMGIGAGSEVRSSMAVAVIGGLVTSTVLTLIIVPVVYTFVDDFGAWLQRARRRMVGSPPGAGEPSASGAASEPAPRGSHS
jgi:hydrophobic/amphiphilic exporter-1 (mainly G- bacteria), HAE1 family